jgi:hypothetical protein
MSSLRLPARIADAWRHAEQDALAAAAALQLGGMFVAAGKAVGSWLIAIKTTRQVGSRGASGRTSQPEPIRLARCMPPSSTSSMRIPAGASSAPATGQASSPLDAPICEAVPNQSRQEGSGMPNHSRPGESYLPAKVMVLRQNTVIHSPSPRV